MPAVLVALLLAQGPASMDVADSLLAQGDTVAGIEALSALLHGERDDVRLAAALALEWIGRDARWPTAVERFQEARPKRRGDVDVPPTDRVLRIAHALHGGEHRGWDAAAVAMVRGILDSAPRPSLLEGASLWMLTRQALARLEAGFVAAIPRAGDQRRCPFRRAAECVQLAGASSASGMSLPGIVRRDSTLDALRLETSDPLLRGLRSSWPFASFAAQGLLALEVLFGDTVSRPAARDAIRDAALPERARRLALAALLAWSGDRGGAHALMAQSPQWFSSLDARTEALGPLPDLEPAIMWRVAWALYLEPVNERQVAHRARVLASGPIARAFPAIAKMLWLETDSSLLVRYGLPVGIARHDAGGQSSGVGDLPIVAYVDRRTRETLLRTTGGVAALGQTGPEALARDLALATRDTVALSGPSGYVDDHFDTFGPLEHQVVQYFREDQPLVEVYVTRPEAQCDTPEKVMRKTQQLAGDGPPSVMGFFLLDGRLGLVRRAVDSVAPGAPRRYTYQVKPAPGVYVYSVEHFDPACRHAARARYVLSVRGLDRAMSLSDIVLSAERRVDGAVRVAGPPRPSALGRLTLSVREPLHLYWEVYGVPADAVERDRFDVAVEVLDLASRKVAVREIPDVARAVEDAPRSLDMRYRAPIVMGDNPLALGLSIDLPPGSEGLHLVRIRMTDLRTGQTAVAQRAVFVTP